MKSILLTTVRRVTATLEVVSPRLAHWWVSRLFFSPRTSRRELPDIPGLQQRWIAYTKINGVQGQCRVYSAGAGPTVLLIHGWEGSASSLSAIARELLAKGLRVVLFDLPAHGFSPGRKTNLVEITRVIQQLAGEEGHFHALVAHSFGGVCAGYAIKSGVAADRIVTISAPATMDFMLDRFGKIIGASKQSIQGLIHRIETILQGPYQQASLTELATVFNHGGLIIHDRKDRMVPYQLAEELATAWPTARLMTTSALGHNRILQNEEVIQAVTSALWPLTGEDSASIGLAVNQ